MIIGGQLSVKLPNYPYPLDVDPVVQIRSLHDCTKKLICTLIKKRIERRVRKKCRVGRTRYGLGLRPGIHPWPR